MMPSLFAWGFVVLFIRRYSTTRLVNPVKPLYFPGAQPLAPAGSTRGNPNLHDLTGNHPFLVVLAGCIHAYMHTCMHAYVHAYIDIHTYLHDFELN